jgi:hypothetical protein
MTDTDVDLEACRLMQQEEYEVLEVSAPESERTSLPSHYSVDLSRMCV